MNEESHEKIMKKLEDRKKEVLSEIKKKQKEAEEKGIYEIAFDIEKYSEKFSKSPKELGYPIEIETYVEHMDYTPTTRISVKYENDVVFKSWGIKARDVDIYVSGKWEEELRELLRKYEKIEEEKTEEKIEKWKKEFGIK